MGFLDLLTDTGHIGGMQLNLYGCSCLQIHDKTLQNSLRCWRNLKNVIRLGKNFIEILNEDR